MNISVKIVIERTRELDESRPVTFVCNAQYDHDVATPFVDVVSINQYEGWYSDPGHTEVIVPRLTRYIDQWHQVTWREVCTAAINARQLFSMTSLKSPLAYMKDQILSCEIFEYI